MTADRFSLAGALALATLAVDAWSGPRLLAYLLGAVGVWAVYERLRAEFPVAVALLTAVLILGGTSLFWSMTRSHSRGATAVFAAIAVLSFLLSRIPRPETRRAWQWGWIVIALLPIVVGALAPASSDGSGGRQLTVAELLFSSSTGLLSLTPIVYLAVIGTVLYLRRNAAVAAASLATVAVWVVGRAFLGSSTGPEPFGHGLTPAIALTAPGLAYLLEKARERPLLAVAPLVVAAIFWNYWLMVQYTSGALPKDEPVSFAAMVRQQADVSTRSPYWYPFAFPANAWRAWRERVPIDRVEQLSSVAVGPVFELVMDRSADRFLLDGWTGVATAPSGAVRWTASRRSTLLFGLAPQSSGLVIELVANARVEDPPVAAELAIEINGNEVGRLSALPTSSELRVAVPAAEVGRIVRAGYNRLGIVSHGIHRLDPLDTRPAGPLAARSAAVPYPVAIHRIRIAPAS